MSLPPSLIRFATAVGVMARPHATVDRLADRDARVAAAAPTPADVADGAGARRTLIDQWGSIPAGTYPSGGRWEAMVAEAQRVLDLTADAAAAGLCTHVDDRATYNALNVLVLDRDQRALAAVTARKAADEARQRRVEAAQRAGVLRDRRDAHKAARRFRNTRRINVGTYQIHYRRAAG